MGPVQVFPAIRPARPGDLPALTRITHERSGGEPEAILGALERFLAHGASGRSLLLVAESGGEVVGFGKCRLHARRRRDPPDPAPRGWYLAGVIVDVRFRRRGIGRALTMARLQWLSERTRRVYYVANARNEASLALHARLGFEEVARGPSFHGIMFEGGEGVLCRAVLASAAPGPGAAPAPGAGSV